MNKKNRHSSLENGRLSQKETNRAHKLIKKGQKFIGEILDPNWGYRTEGELINALQDHLTRYAPEANLTIVKRRDPHKRGTRSTFYDDVTRMDVEVNEGYIGVYPMIDGDTIYLPILQGAKYLVIRSLGENAKELFHTIKDGMAREYFKSITTIAKYNQDKLTGAYNRQFVEAFSREHTPETMEQSGKRFVIFGIDLNAFKEINDQLGHDMGDKALMIATEVLQKVFGRQGDFVCRMSGDEFVVIIDASAWDEKLQEINTQIFKRKILLELGKIGSTWIPPERMIDNPPSLGLSIGVSHMDKDSSLEKALIEADLAMLREKPEIGGVMRIAGKLKDIKNLSLIPLVLRKLKEIPGITTFQETDQSRVSEIIDELSEIFARNSAK